MTYEAAHNAIRARFNTQYSAPTRVAWPNAEFTPPTDDTTVWVRFTILDGASRQASAGAAANMHRHPGLVVVNIFAPLNRGDKAALETVDEVSAIFRNWQDASNRIRFFSPEVERVGPEEKWYQINVSFMFERDTAF